jgi:hypothetical protein
VVQDGSTAGRGRPGIIPGASTPLDVTQSSTPAMSVKVKAGTIVQTSSDSPGGVYTHTLGTDTDLTIGTAPGSNSRWDVVVAKVFDDGTTPVTTIEVLQGTSAPSPAYPSALTSPPTNTLYFPLAKIVVGTSVSSIVNANISKPAAAGGLPTFGQFTAAPGGQIPVANLTAAAELPLYTPFYSIADRAHGTVLPGGASLDGMQHRYINAFGVATNGNGDTASMSYGLFLAGTFTAAPFPNGCKGVALQNASSWLTVDAPLVLTTSINTWPLSASSCLARVYFGNGTKYISAALDVQGIAWGW